jgi:hypothetical protein
MKASVNKKLIAILTPIGAVVLAGIILLIVFLTGGFTKTDLDFVGIEGMEQVNIDTNNRIVALSVDSAVSVIDTKKLLTSKGTTLILYSDPECTKLVDTMELQDGENIFYAKILDKKDGEKIWVIKINKEKSGSGDVDNPDDPVLTVKSISLVSATNVYTLNQAFEDELNVEYSDGSIEKIAVTSDMLTNFSTSSVGKKSVTLAYGNLRLNFDIIVRDVADSKYLVGVEVESFKNSYQLDCQFLGGTLKLKYNDGTDAIILLTEAMLSNFKTDTLGDNSATINYLGFGANASYNVKQAFEQVDIHRFDSLLAQAIGLVNSKLNGNSFSGSYEEALWILTSDVDPRINQVIDMLNESLTSIGITNGQVESLLNLFINKLYPAFDKAFDPERMGEGPYSATFIDKDVLEQFADCFSDLMNIFDSNDITNIVYSLNYDKLNEGYDNGEEVIHSLPDLIAALGADKTFFEDINGGIKENLIINKSSREDFGNQMLSSYAFLEDFIAFNKADFVTAFNLIEDMLRARSGIFDLYPASEMINTIKFAGDVFKSISIAFANQDIVSSLIDMLAGSNFWPKYYLQAGIGDFAGFVSEIIEDLTLSDMTDFVNYYIDYNDTQAKQSIIIGKLFIDKWEEISKAQQANIILYLDSIIASPTEDIALKIVDYFYFSSEYYIDNLEDMSDEDINIVDQELDKLWDLFMPLEESEDFYVQVTLYRDIIVRKGTSLKEMLDYYAGNIQACYVANGEEFIINIVTSGEGFLINIYDGIVGYDSSVAGKQEFYIYSNGKRATVPFYVVDETTEITYTSYEAASYKNTVALGGEISFLAPFSSMINYYIPEIGYYDYFYESFYDGVMPVKQTDLYNVKTDIATIGDATLTGFYIVNDIILGNVYMPFSYYVYDENDIQIIEFIELDRSNTFVKGENFEGVTLRYWGNNYDSNEILLTNDMISNFDNNLIGLQTITITIGDYVGYFDVFVVNEIDEELVIEIQAYPYQDIYMVNDIISKEDIQVSKYYNNGNGWSVDDEDFEISYDTSKEGICEITVTAYGYEITTCVKVISASYAETITNIEFRGDHTKYYYFEGEEIEYNIEDEETSLIVTYGGGYDYAYYSALELSAEAKFTSNFDSTTPGVKKLYFMYDGVKIKGSYYYTIYATSSTTEVAYVWVSYCNEMTLNFDPINIGVLNLDYVYPYQDPTQVRFSDPRVTITGLDTSKVGETTFVVEFEDWKVTVDTYVYDPDTEDFVTAIRKLFLYDSVYYVGEDPSSIDLTFDAELFYYDWSSRNYDLYITGEDVIAKYLVEGTGVDTSTAGTKSFKVELSAYFDENNINYFEGIGEIELFYTVIERPSER